MTEDNISNFSARQILLKGSLIAIILTGCSLGAFAAAWYVLDDLLSAIIVSGMIYLIAMIISIKISRKFFSNNPKSNRVL